VGLLVGVDVDIRAELGEVFRELRIAVAQRLGEWPGAGQVQAEYRHVTLGRKEIVSHESRIEDLLP